MSKTAQSEFTNSFLARHLAGIENEKDVVLKEFYPNVSAESIKFEQFIADYIKSIENYIQNAQASENNSMQIPFVIIGSTVDIQDIDDQTVKTVRIVSPFLNQGQVNYTFASYLSPLGRELLLKRKGERIKVKLPAGYSHYLIKDIRFS